MLTLNRVGLCPLHQSSFIRRNAAFCHIMLQQLHFIANWTRFSSRFYFKPGECAGSDHLAFLLTITWLFRSIAPRF